MDATIELLRHELERQFTPEELTDIADNVLGVGDTPSEAGSPALFALRVAERCVASDRLLACADVLVASGKSVDHRLIDLLSGKSSSLLSPGTDWAGFSIDRQTGSWALGALYAATLEGEAYDLFLLSESVRGQRASVHRYLTAQRLATRAKFNSVLRRRVGEEAGMPFVAVRRADGESLRSWMSKNPRAEFGAAEKLLLASIEALAELHDTRFVHGALRGDTIYTSGDNKVVFAELGTDRLDPRAGAATPEGDRGQSLGLATDVYALGALMFEMLSGLTPARADGKSLADLVPCPPAVSDLVSSMLATDADKRPANARRVLELWKNAAGGSRPAESTRAVDVSAALAAFDKDIKSTDAALTLEQAAHHGDRATDVLKRFEAAADSADANAELKRDLLARAARLAMYVTRQTEDAERVLRKILELDTGDAFASEALEELLRRTGRHEELVEGLLARTETASSPADKARAFAELGRVFARDLNDREQAIVALTQAVCSDPSEASYITELERLCGSNATAWEDVLSTAMDALKAGALGAQERVDLLLFVASGYERHAGRSDMAVLAYDQVLATAPGHEGAHRRRVAIFRRASQWNELATALEALANASVSASKVSAARAEAAEVVYERLKDSARAEALLMRAVEEDPNNRAALTLLSSIVEKAGDADKWLAIVERQAGAATDKSAADVWARAGKIWEEQRGNAEQALVRYERALAVDPRCLEALRGQERVWSKQGKHKDVIENLLVQAELAATPRQHVGVLEHVARLYDEEFYDHQRAAETFERLLEIDPKNDNALVNLARHYRALQKHDRFLAALDAHLAVVSDPARRTELLMGKARALATDLGSPDKAMRTYEELLAVDPHHAGALEALAALRETSGDVHAALTSIETLAEKGATPEARSEQWTRAAKFLESRGDKDAAIERYKRALSESPNNTAASAGLRAAYEERGDRANVIALLEAELKNSEGDLARARLYAEMARVHYSTGSSEAAERAVTRAIELDPSHAGALVVAGDLAFDAHRFREAIVRYESVLGRISTLSAEESKRVLVRYIESYGRANAKQTNDAPSSVSIMPMSTTDLSSLAPPSMMSLVPPGETHPKLRAAVDMLWTAAGDDRHALADASVVLFEHGEPAVALDAHRKLLSGEGLRGAERASALYRLGESARRVEELEEAEKALKEATQLDATLAPAWKSLARVYSETGRFEEAAAALRRRVDTSAKADRFDALIELADTEFLRLGKRGSAQESYAKALEERPGDRRLLAKLMQIHTEGKDWEKLLGVVRTLADGIDDTAQRAKYLHTAAAIAYKHIKDFPRAKELYAAALEDDASNTKAAEEYLRLLDETGDAETSEEVLNVQLDVARENGDANRMRSLLDRVAALYENKLNEPSMAIDAYEAAHAFAPDDRERADKLAALYAKNPAEYLGKAEESQAAMLRHNPYRVESYKLLRQMYTDVRAADPAWCMCQALAALKLAEPDEERFFLKHRKTTPAVAKAIMSSADRERLRHEDADPVLTALFALLRPSIESVRAKSLAELGIAADSVKAAASDSSLLGQTANYAAGVFGIAALPVAAAAGTVHFVAGQQPLLVGTCAITGKPEDAQIAAFHVARSLWLSQGGYAVRTLVPSATGLKAWVYAAIRLVLPSFSMPEELESTAAECTEVLRRDMVGNSKDELIALVGKLRAGASVDLGRWTNGVDLTADRAGLLLCHDLATALAEMRKAGEGDSALPAKERSKELVLFGVSRPYFDVRAALKVGIES